MHLLDLLLLAVGLAMDAFAVAVSCGFAFQRREHLGALRIALSFGLFQAAMPVLGWAAGLSVRHQIEAWDHWIAFALLVVTSIDALAVGLSLSFLQVEIATPALVIGLVTFAMSFAGIVLGFELEHRLRGRWRRNIQVAGGVILIAIGARILVEHTIGA
ncbi:MAG: manganese efflux pump MntP family protein [Acidobacteria bacterium]|nr:manganese efflux pump MntP family protein [Acidobacteriota bacterium]